jgi:hypothetical protein
MRVRLDRPPFFDILIPIEIRSAAWLAAIVASNGCRVETAPSFAKIHSAYEGAAVPAFI